IRSHASPAQRTGSPLVPAARHQGRGAPCGESFWHWALGADGGHGHAQPPFRSSRLIGAERQPTSDCRQSLQQSPYEHAYNVAQQQGGAGRDSEMPPMRDRQTMARRVRGYVTQSKTNTSLGASAPGRVTSSERKALATMGRKGGQKAAQRWKTDPEGQYAQNQLQKLKKTHRKKRVEGQTTRAKIQALIGEAYVQTGEVLTRKQIVDETGLSRATVTRHLAALREQGALPET